MLLLSVFLIVPSIYGFWLSLHEFDGINLGAWSGLGQYQAVLADPEFRRSLWHTVVFAIVVVIGKNAVGLALAVLVSAPLKGARLARTLLFLPVTMNVIVVGAFWTFFLSARRFGGLFNEMLNSVGLGMLETSWLSSEQTALVSVAAVEIWRWAGLHMLLFLAGMQVIEPQLYDAGRMDGANAWVRFWHITVPQLGPVLSVSILLALMGAFVRSFDVVWVLTRGGFGTDVVVTHMYNEAFQFSRFGRAAAMGYVLFAIIAIITFTFVLISRRKLRDV
ncbi:carbohydrate ABC transporter permease [Rhizobium leguminosarum]|uniref:carbohydrate ABC transporter permease n=1 Tax=Rhizobium leguminosarum TaxID=384 RepID=UPI00067EBCFE|nr:sugar ABC transporter permease [Rhizobium leguminosarum]